MQAEQKQVQASAAASTAQVETGKKASKRYNNIETTNDVETWATRTRLLDAKLQRVHSEIVADKAIKVIIASTLFSKLNSNPACAAR